MDLASARILLGTAGAGEVLPTVIGEEALGGYFAGYISHNGNGVATHGLIVAPKSTVVTRFWKTSNTASSHTNSAFDGATNTSDINNSTHPAAQYCASLSSGGFSDWYLPSAAELEIAYYNFKPTTSSNNTSSGPTSFNGSTYTSPSRSANYTAGTPSQTSVSVFQSGGAQAFNSGLNVYHWTSNENNNDGIAIQFEDGRYNKFRTKAFSNYVRAFRRFAV
jgi:hypothetical protein